MNCPVAPRLESLVPDRGSDFALEGTLAHAYCAYALKERLGLPTDGEVNEIDHLQRYYSTEMDGHVDTYFTLVMEKYAAAQATTRDAKLLVETRLDFSDFVPDAFGTADAIIIADGTMEVVDFKYGKGVRVDAEHNPQMMIYALGAWQRFSFDYDIGHVRMTIVQPRLDHISEWEISAPDLLKWAKEELTPAAKLAHSGKGEQHPGDWCRFCRVRGNCKALAEKCLAASAIDPRMLSPKEMGEKVLPNLATIKAWLSDVEEYALQKALEGTVFPGFKVVEGRSIRRITNPQALAYLLQQKGYDEDRYLKPRELVSLGDLEKLVGKKAFAQQFAEFITKPQGKPTLAPESDKRPVFNSAADDFKGIDI